MTTVESARHYEELLGDSVAASPYEFATLFKAEGFLGRQRNKKRLKLLKAVDVKVRHILERGEKVYLVTTGTNTGSSERLLAGWLAYSLNRRALVLTSRRILLLHINPRQRPLELVSQLPYASIASVKPGWGGTCAIKLLNREVLNFQYIPTADRKFLMEFLADIVHLTNAPFEQKRGIEHLCPHCYVFVPEHPAACPSCSGRFKSAGLAGALSLLFPGLGGFYIGHRWFAALEFIGAAALWYFLVGVPLSSAYDPQGGSPLDAEYWMTTAAIIALVHAIDALITRHFARKGHFPRGMVPLAASLPPFVDRPKPNLAPLNKLKISRTTPPM